MKGERFEHYSARLPPTICYRLEGGLQHSGCGFPNIAEANGLRQTSQLSRHGGF
jgi:hypothetical protein